MPSATIQLRRHMQMLLNIPRVYTHKGKQALLDFYVVAIKDGSLEPRLSDIKAVYDKAEVAKDAKRILIPAEQVEAYVAKQT